MRTRDENKEAAIREKAIAMIVKEGLDGFGVNKLARAAGVSPATIYIYYKDKDDLILKIGMEVVQDILFHSLKNFDPAMPFEEGMKVQWKNRAAYFTEHPTEVQFMEVLRYSRYYDEVMKHMTNSFAKVMGQFVHNAVARKELIANLPLEVYWSVAFAPLYQLIKFHTQERSFSNRKFSLTNRMLMQTLDLVLKALKP